MRDQEAGQGLSSADIRGTGTPKIAGSWSIGKAELKAFGRSGMGLARMVY